jgi:hypothetical protein
MERIRRVAPLALLALGLGLAALLYRGPARGIVRGHGGDVAAAMLLYAALGALPWPRTPGGRALLAGAIALGLELGQLLWTGHGLAGELLIGSTFDPLDLLAYALGLLLALAYDRARQRDYRPLGV